MNKNQTPADAPATDAPAAPETAEMTIEEMKAEMARLRAELAARPERPVRKATAADWRRTIDLALIEYAGNLIAGSVPDDLQKAVARLVSNQLHHLSTPELGWPSTVLPVPDRSDWR